MRPSNPDERELDPRKPTQQLHDAGFDEVRLRYIDLTLIPTSFLLAGKPGWPLIRMRGSGLDVVS
jgi:hypothetical protein